MERIGNITLYNADCIQVMQSMESESVNVILTDPPYLYLKNQKLDRPFEETAFFNEAKRVLKKDGFIVMFGRGTSFYRWNTILAGLGFKFKEEIVWNKKRTTSPLLPLMRVHETICIYCKGNKSINRCKISVFEKYKFEPHKIDRILERINTVFGNRKSFELLKKYYENNERVYERTKDKFNISRSKNSNLSQNRTIIFAQSLEEGTNEADIISESGDHYTAIHPTQKPVRLLERLLALVSKEGDLVLDPFCGSGSVAIAAYNMNLGNISIEIDSEYYESAMKRIKEHVKQLKIKYNEL